MKDWDAELKKIDKQLESISDSALIPSAPPARGAPATAQQATAQQATAAQTKVAAQRAETRSWPAFVRLALATALGVGILFWPYPSRCGVGLAGYLAAVAVVTLGGLWSSVWTWRHHTARAHVLSLLLVGWGMLLGAMELLPRLGYAKADAARPAGFSCTAPQTQATPTGAPAAVAK